MSTHSTIGVANRDGSIRAIYCHFDGYLKGVGTCLVLEHDSYAAAMKLIERGPLNSCFPGKPVQEFDGPSDVGLTKTFTSFDSYLICINTWMYASYHYLFRDGDWYVSGYGCPDKSHIIKVEEALHLAHPESK